MITNKATPDDFPTIAPGDRMEIWWPSAARHVWVTVLAVELKIGRRFVGGHYVLGADFTVYNPHSYVYEPNGHQKTVKRVAVLPAHLHGDDVRQAYTPDARTLTAFELASLLGYHAEHGGPERNCVVPDEVLAAAQA